MFSIFHRYGTWDENPPLDALSDLYDELQAVDPEHVDVSVVHDDSGWSMSAYQSGRLVFEHLEQGGECHMIPVSKDRVLELWRLLAAGDIDTIRKEPWRPGYA
jgi:hypothetical protein